MRNPIGRTKCKSLVKACEEGYTDIVKELLKYDVDINEAIDDGDSPLFTACWSGHEEVVQVLLSHKEIDVNKRSNVDNLTPLYIASQEGYHEIVDLLLKKGADVNTPDENDLTPLMIAAYFCNIDVVRLLWNSPECQKDTNVEYRTAREWGECEDDLECVPEEEFKIRRDKVTENARFKLLSVMT
eukprot:g421.t1